MAERRPARRRRAAPAQRPTRRGPAGELERLLDEHLRVVGRRVEPLLVGVQPEREHLQRDGRGEAGQPGEERPPLARGHEVARAYEQDERGEQHRREQRGPDEADVGEPAVELVHEREAAPLVQRRRVVKGEVEEERREGRSPILRAGYAQASRQRRGRPEPGGEARFGVDVQ